MEKIYCFKALHIPYLMGIIQEFRHYLQNKPIPFSTKNCHSYGSKLWLFQGKSTVLLDAKYGGLRE